MIVYNVKVSDRDGRPLPNLSPAYCMAAARQRILDAAGLADLPADGPEYGVLGLDNIVEGWFINGVEYAIRQDEYCG